MNVCIICETPADKTFTEKTIEKFVHNLQQFESANLLKDDIKVRLLSNGKEQLVENLRGGLYSYHKSCYDSFNESKFQRAISAKKRKLSNEDEPYTSTRAKVPSTISFGDEVCMYCDQPAVKDKKHPQYNNPLCAAAAKQKSSKYVDNFTQGIRKMALEMGDTKIMKLLGECTN